MNTQLKSILALAGLFVIANLQAQSVEALKNLKWRAIGPANMGGRVTDIVGVPGNNNIFYVAGADGGIFKTINAGTTFEALFTDQKSYSVGALALAGSSPDIIWLGSGEGDPRNSVGYGHGVYRSMDGGKTWKHLGLEKTERIKRIVVDPTNPDIACVCALGKEWGPNPDRGVFKTTDGGKTWRKVLYINDDTGCSDLAMEWNNPRILYAGMWTFRRKPWRFDDGGGATALYRSLDGGETWEKSNKGLLNQPMARIGVSIAQSQPTIVYMITEFKGGGTLFRSEDRGASWRMVNDDPNINFRPFYYSDIRVDPANPDIIYSLSGRLTKSTDGGRNFTTIARGVHGDHQSFWIDPENSKRLLSGSDGGFQVSYDAGDTWDIINNIELSQFYQLNIDDQDPYNVYGGLQDNGTWYGPSNSLNRAGILKRHWKKLAGGDGYYAVPIPGSEHEVYANLQGGVIFHVDTRTGNVRNIHPYPKITGSAGDAIENHKYRFNWDSPIYVSPNDPNTVYFGGNVLFKSTDRGNSWEVLGGDLTNNDKSKQRSSGGEIYQDNTAAEFHNTILTIAESPLEKDVIWVGTDDGNVQITRDGGKNWTNVTSRIKGFPPFGWVGKIHASEHSKGTAFVVVDHHRSDDFKPYIFTTSNYGQTWTKISDGLPQDDYVKVCRQDPHNENILYAGMEHGIFVSWNKGTTWMKLNNNLPPVSVRDLRIQGRERDLVIGTHGRGVWILDDIRPLEDLAAASTKDVHLFEVRPATQWIMYSQIENMGDRIYSAANPRYGAYINFYLKNPARRAKVSIKDQAGNVIRTLQDSARAGVNRMVWGLDHNPATRLNRGGGGGFFFGGFGGPNVAPGTYTAMLEVNGQMLETPVIVKADPRVEMSEVDYQLRTQTALAIRDLQSEVNEMLNKSQKIDDQLKDLKNKLNPGDVSLEEIKSAVDAAMKKLEEITNQLTTPPPAMNYRQKPELAQEIRSLLNAVDNATARPTEPQLNRAKELSEETTVMTNKFNEFILNEISNVNKLSEGIPSINVGGPITVENN